MANCKSSGFNIPLEQMGKLKDQDIVFVSVTEQLSSCARIDARTIDTAGVSNLADGYAYNAANVPRDEFGCSKNKCANTGTFQGEVQTAGENVIIGDFRKTMDANLYLFGLVTGYVMLPDGDHTVTLDIAAYTESGWDNYSSSTYVVHARNGNNGSANYPVVFDLTQIASTQGTGWTGGMVGTKLRVTIDGKNLKANDRVGLSSLAFWESSEDLEVNKVIALGCINTIGSSQSFDVIEGQCAESEYNTNSGTETVSFTINKWSKNFEWLNPAWHTSEEETFGIPYVVTRKVIAGTGDLEGWGVIQLSDMDMTTCGFVYINTPGCVNSSTELTRISSPIPIKFTTADGNKFQVLTTSFNGIENMGTILVHKDWVGSELNVIYRQLRTAEVSYVNNEFRDFNVNILVPYRQKDKTIIWHYYENAFMTVDNWNISRTDDTTREVSFTVATDENGVKYKIIRELE